MAADAKQQAEKEARELIKQAKLEAKEIKKQARADAKEIKKAAYAHVQETLKKKKEAATRERKIKFLHTRVPVELERKIKEKADEMKVPVSILIRNILDDEFK
jgi:hypothetical protein